MIEHNDKLGRPIKEGDWCVASYAGFKNDGIALFRVTEASMKTLKLKNINTKKEKSYTRKYSNAVVKINEEDMIMYLLKRESK